MRSKRFKPLINELRNGVASSCAFEFPCIRLIRTMSNSDLFMTARLFVLATIIALFCAVLAFIYRWTFCLSEAAKVGTVKAAESSGAYLGWWLGSAFWNRLIGNNTRVSLVDKDIGTTILDQAAHFFVEIARWRIR